MDTINSTVGSFTIARSQANHAKRTVVTAVDRTCLPSSAASTKTDHTRNRHLLDLVNIARCGRLDWFIEPADGGPAESSAIILTNSLHDDLRMHPNHADARRALLAAYEANGARGRSGNMVPLWLQKVHEAARKLGLNPPSPASLDRIARRHAQAYPPESTL